MSSQDKTTIKIVQKDYDFKYPNVGQTLNIESVKLALSGGIYGELVKSSHKTAVELLNLIDGFAYFSSLSAEFEKDFPLGNFTEMEIPQRVAISKGFVQYWKWYNDMEAEINRMTTDAGKTGE